MQLTFVLLLVFFYFHFLIYKNLVYGEEQLVERSKTIAELSVNSGQLDPSGAGLGSKIDSVRNTFKAKVSKSNK